MDQFPSGYIVLPFLAKLEPSNAHTYLIDVVVVFDVAIDRFQDNYSNHNWKNTDNDYGVQNPVPMYLGVAVHKEQIPSTIPINSFLQSDP